jgi:hypothetical protein
MPLYTVPKHPAGTGQDLFIAQTGRSFMVITVINVDGVPPIFSLQMISCAAMSPLAGRKSSSCDSLEAIAFARSDQLERILINIKTKRKYLGGGRNYGHWLTLCGAERRVRSGGRRRRALTQSEEDTQMLQHRRKSSM